MITARLFCVSLAGMALMSLASALPAKPTVPFIAGADCSHVGYFETLGLTYKDQGKPTDPFAILKRHGVNCVRLRLFTGDDTYAKADPYNCINNLTYTLALAVRVKRAGLRLLISFHYSDTWADPAKQAKPAAWKDLDFDQLESKMYRYNYDCIDTFKKAGAMPDYVMVGNEITPGMLWPDGQVGGAYDTPEQWARLGRLMKAAVRGIREASGSKMPKLIVHIDRGGSWDGTKWFFDNLIKQDVPFDIIGESYYPFYHGNLASLTTCLNNAAERYGKPVVIAETDFPWVEGDLAGKETAGFTPGKAGQIAFIEAVEKIVKGVPNGKGIGIFYWGAEYLPVPSVNLGGYDRRSFFDHDGNALASLDAFGRMAKAKR